MGLDFDIVSQTNQQINQETATNQDIELQDRGAAGVGVPTGGNENDVLTKKSNVPYDTEWRTPSSGLVSSVFGREGDIVAATNDYDDTQIYVDDTDLSAATSGGVTGNNVHAILLSICVRFNAIITTILNALSNAFDKTQDTTDDIDEGTTNLFFTNARADARIQAQKGTAYGIAELDENGMVITSQLPSYVDDVIEVANFAALPVTGESGKIYITQDDNKTWRWTGSGYAEISSSLALGETSATAYRGDRGKTAYDHSQTNGNPHGTTKSDVGLGNVDNTSDTNKPISSATQTALDLKVDETTIAASGKGFVNHGATASTARPSGYASVEWVGSVEPTNAIDGDSWIDTSS